MNFEVNLSGQHAAYFLGTAGVEARQFIELIFAVVTRNAKLPAEISARYFLSDEPENVRITVLSLEPNARLRIEVGNESIGKKIQERLNACSVENNGDARDNREHKELWAQIDAILKREGLSYDDCQRGATLPRRALESLMELCGKAIWFRKVNINSLFTEHAVGKSDRLFVVTQLLKWFEAERDPNSQLGIRIWDLAVPQIADDLIRIIQEPRHGENRGALCLALAKTKHPRAAEVIASVLGQEGITRWALEALGKLKSAEHAEQAREFLSDANSDIRREAKKTLKKMGLPVETPPPPAHLVKNRRLLPKGLEEWSMNLDMEDLEPTLQALARNIESGFGTKEIAEVIAVAGEMEPDQTKAFRFPILEERKPAEVWLVIFMDDIDAPDLEIHGNADLIRRFDQAVPKE